MNKTLNVCFVVTLFCTSNLFSMGSSNSSSSSSSSLSSNSSGEIVFKIGNNVLKSDDGTFLSFFKNCLLQDKDSLEKLPSAVVIDVFEKANSCKELFKALDKNISFLGNNIFSAVKDALTKYMDAYGYSWKDEHDCFVGWETVKAQNYSGIVCYLIEFLDCCKFCYETIGIKSQNEIFAYLKNRNSIDAKSLRLDYEAEKRNDEKKKTVNDFFNTLNQ